MQELISWTTSKTKEFPSFPGIRIAKVDRICQYESQNMIDKSLRTNTTGGDLDVSRLSRKNASSQARRGYF
jgi:hypothetical protein